MADERQTKPEPDRQQLLEQKYLTEQVEIENFLNSASPEELGRFAGSVTQPGNVQHLLDIFAQSKVHSASPAAKLRGERAAFILRNLQQETARNYIYVQVIRFRQAPAIEIAKETTYAPADPHWRVAFFILAGCWDNYYATDPDGSLLAETFQKVKGVTLQDLVRVIRQAGRPDLLQTVPPLTKGQKFELERLNWPAIQTLEREKRFEELWEIALESSAYWSSIILRLLKRNGWQPDEKHNLPLFEKLTSLVETLPEELPYGLLKNSAFKLYTLGALGKPLDVETESSYFEISPNGQFLAKIIVEVPAISASLSLHQLPEGKTVAFFEPYFDLLTPNPSLALQRLANRVTLTTLSFSPDSKWLATGGHWIDKLNHQESAALWVFDIESQQRVSATQLRTPTSPLKIALSSDKTFVAVLGQKWLQLYRGKTTLTLVKELKADSWESFSDINFSPDSQMLGLGLQGGQIRLFELPDLTLLRQFDTGASEITHLKFSPDGQTLAFGAQLGWLHVADGAPVCRFDDNPTAVSALTFSPNGELLATGHANGMLRVWSAAGSYNIEYTDSGNKPVALAFSPDGQQFITIEESGLLMTQTSRLAYLYNMPVAQGTLQDLKWLVEAAASTTNPYEKAFYDFIAAQLDLKWRFEYEIEMDVTPVLPACDFDIELED